MKRILIIISFIVVFFQLEITGWKSVKIHATTIGTKQAKLNRLQSQVKTEQPQENKPLGYMEPEKLLFPAVMSDEWEIDCYSRPVLTADGKKLWEVLITDSKSDFRYIKVLPSNLVNSRTLRKTVEEVIEASPVRPKLIRFFRNQMYNMISIALETLEIQVKPSRRVNNLLMWLQDREKHVYPKMKGYNPSLKQQTLLDYEVNKADRLPDIIRAQKYSFVALPAEAFWNKEVNEENINKGYLANIRDLPKTGWVHGITLFSSRASAIASWMVGLEIAHIKAELITRELLLATDITQEYIMAPLTDNQIKEAKIFEKGKNECNGYHFLSIQESPESEDVQAFWLLREFDKNL